MKNLCRVTIFDFAEPHDAIEIPQATMVEPSRIEAM
jgi:hypothetical protein